MMFTLLSGVLTAGFGKHLDRGGQQLSFGLRLVAVSAYALVISVIGVYGFHF